MLVVVLAFFVRAALGLWDQLDESFFDAYPGVVFNVYYYAQFLVFEWMPLLAVSIVIRETRASSSASASAATAMGGKGETPLSQPLLERRMMSDYQERR